MADCCEGCHWQVHRKFREYQDGRSYVWDEEEGACLFRLDKASYMNELAECSFKNKRLPVSLDESSHEEVE